MNKTFFMILSFVIFIVCAIMLWYFLTRTGEPELKALSNVTLPVAVQNASQEQESTVKPTQKKTLLLPTTDGDFISVLNFLENPMVTDSLIGEYYNIGGFTTIQSPFMIIYIANTKYFNIELLQEPLGRSREVAEQYLRQQLGISPSEMCRLNYAIGAPSFVSDFYGGAELGFSFCPGATKLPL